MTLLGLYFAALAIPKLPPWPISVLFVGFIIAGILLFLTGLAYLARIVRRYLINRQVTDRKGSESQEELEQALSIEIDNCSWGNPVIRGDQPVQTIEVALTLNVKNPPVNVIDLELYMGDEIQKFMGASPTVPFRQENKKECYIATYELFPATSYKVPIEKRNKYHLCVVAIGQKWPSKEFPITIPNHLLAGGKEGSQSLTGGKAIQNPEIVVKSDPEDNYVRLHVANRGAKATFKATAQIVENSQLIRSSWPVRWRGSLREEQEIDRDGHHILDLASIGIVHSRGKVISTDEVAQDVTWATFYTADLSIVGGRTSEHFPAPKMDSMILHIKITSDPPQEKTYEKRWVLIPNEGEGKSVPRSLILREANGN